MEISHKSSVLVIEHRDEVFARLLYDLSALGFNVERATSAREASVKFDSSQAQLVLMNREISREERGWHLVAKWALQRRQRRFWLYTAWPCALDVPWAEFVKVEKLHYYAGDVWRLAAQITEQLSYEYPPFRKNLSSCASSFVGKNIKRGWCKTTRTVRRAVALTFAAILLVIATWQHSTAQRVVVHIKSLCCQCCTSHALAELACLRGVSRSWADERESNLVLEINQEPTVSPRRIWEAIESTHLEPTSLSVEQETFWSKPTR